MEELKNVESLILDGDQRVMSPLIFDSSQQSFTAHSNTITRLWTYVQLVIAGFIEWK